MNQNPNNTKFSIRPVVSSLISRYYLKNSEYHHLVDDYLARASFSRIIHEGLNHLAFLLGSRKVIHPPRCIRFEVTNFCNLQCKMCPQPKLMQRKKQHLDFDLYRQVIDANPFIEEVDLFNWGEPLIHPRFIEFVQEATNRGIYTRMVTNAVLLDEQKARLLLNAGIGTIYISMEGTGHDYEKIRNTSFKQVIDNIKTLLSQRNKTGSSAIIRISITAVQSNSEHLQSIKQELSFLNIDQIEINSCQDYSSDTPRTTPCMEPYRYLVVLSNGDCVPCCVDFDAQLKIGSVKDHLSLKKIFNSKEIQRLRKNLQKHNSMPLLCKSCTFRTFQ